MSQQDSAERIVAGVDGSDSSIEALRWAIRQAELTGAMVEATIAWHFPLLLGGYAWPPVGILETTDFAGMAGKFLNEAVTKAVGGGDRTRITEVVKEGDAAQVLIEQADGASLLVVGSRGHGGFAEALLGSVSQHCVHHSRCPVVIIRGVVSAS
jgi:nucleotide-binding universal stress UspA family protein